MSYTIEFYKKTSGRIPVQEYLDELDRKNRQLRASVLRDLVHLEQFGPILTMPDVRYMKDGLYELRSSSGSDISRVFYFFYSGTKIILTNGFVKKSQKTPSTELEKAFRYKKDYEARK